MAAHNGIYYIRRQIASILPQLDNDDELIVVDDASTDETTRAVEDFCDSRILLVRNERNIGPIHSFERALQKSTGQLIFLSDQDDIWAANKISTILDVFAKDPDVTLVSSGVTL